MLTLRDAIHENMDTIMFMIGTSNIIKERDPEYYTRSEEVEADLINMLCLKSYWLEEDEVENLIYAVGIYAILRELIRVKNQRIVETSEKIGAELAIDMSLMISLFCRMKHTDPEGNYEIARFLVPVLNAQLLYMRSVFNDEHLYREIVAKGYIDKLGDYIVGDVYGTAFCEMSYLLGDSDRVPVRAILTPFTVFLANKSEDEK